MLNMISEGPKTNLQAVQEAPQSWVGTVVDQITDLIHSSRLENWEERVIIKQIEFSKKMELISIYSDFKSGLEDVRSVLSRDISSGISQLADISRDTAGKLECFQADSEQGNADVLSAASVSNSIRLFLADFLVLISDILGVANVLENFQSQKCAGLREQVNKGLGSVLDEIRQSVRQEMSEANIKLNSAEQNVLEIESYSKCKEQELEQLRLALKNIQREEEATWDHLEKERGFLGEFESTLNAEQLSLEHYKEALTRWESQGVKQIKSELAELDNEIDGLNQALTSTQQKYKSIVERPDSNHWVFNHLFNHSKQELEQAERELKDRTKTLSELIQRRTSSYSGLERTTESLKKEIHNFSEGIRVTTEDIVSAKQSITQAEEALQDRERAVLEISSKINETKQELDDLRTERQDKIRVREAASEDFEKKRSLIIQLKDQISGIKSLYLETNSRVAQSVNSVDLDIQEQFAAPISDKPFLFLRGPLSVI